MKSIGSVSVDVVPDATGFAEKLKAKLRDVNVKVGVNLDATKARAEIDKLATMKRSVTIKAEADTAAAKARLDELARTRTSKIKASVDKSSISQASSSLDGLNGSMGALMSSVIAFGPALIPVTAAVAGLAGALAAPAIAAGGGLGIFGLITKGALAKAKKDAQDIAALNKKAATATSSKKAAEFTKQADALMKSLPKAEQAFLHAKNSISRGFDQLLAKSGGAIFEPLTKGALLLGRVLPRLSPVADAFGRAIGRMIDQLGAFSKTSGFTSVLSFMATTGVRAFESMVRISRNVVVGLAGIVSAFVPMGTTVLGTLDRLTARFAVFGQNINGSGGFAGFMAYVRQVGPEVGRTIQNVSVAVGHLVLALAPQGGTMLAVIDGLARGVAKLSPGKINAIAFAVGALGLATGKLGKLTSLSLLVTAVSYAYKHSDAFHKLADGAVRFASAINSLPSGIKIAVGAVAGLAALNRTATKVGGPVSVVSKVLGGGVQKVFVVNMGKGGLPGAPGGPGSKPIVTPPAGGGGGGGVGSFFKGLAGSVFNTAGFLAINKAFETFENHASGAAVKTQGLQGDLLKLGKTGQASGQLTSAFGKNLEHLGVQAGTVASHSSGIMKGFLNIDKGLSKVFPDGELTKRAKSVGDLDKALARVNYAHPAAGARAYNELLKKSGLSAQNFAKALPLATAAMHQMTTRAQGGKVATQSLFKQFSSGVSRSIALSAALHKTGLSAQDYNKKLRTLPKFLQTKVTTPGAVTSKGQVKALQRQYGLTKPQVRTLMILAGVNKAMADAARARATFAALNRTYTTSLNVVINRRINDTAGKPLPSSAGQSATGGWIRGPGTGTSDSVPQWLSNGEFVVNAAAAARNAELLQAINGNTKRTASSQHYASGGPVSGVGGGGLTVNYNGAVYAHDPDELARKLAARDRAAMAIAGGP